MNKKNHFLGSLRFFNHKTTIVFLTLAVLFLFLAPPVLALDTGLEYGTYTGLGVQDLRISIMKIVRVILGFVGVIAILIILYGGYTWMTSAGNPEKIEKAKKILTNAVIGLVIIFSAFAIVSFIIRALQEATGIFGPPPGGGPPAGCENCGHLGSGIIQSVYPEPGARDVARNTKIMVTFKVEMKPETIIDGAPATCSAAVPCSGNLVSNNVLIFPTSQKEAAKLTNAQVRASSNDGKTFVFQPINYLGDGINNVWYSVKLTGAIKKDNGDSAFAGVRDFFLWRFEVGTLLDLDPVEVGNVFPQPDNQGDSYSLTPAQAASGSVTVGSNPNVVRSAAVNVKRIAPPYTCNDDEDNNGNGRCDKNGCCDDGTDKNQSVCVTAGSDWLLGDAVCTIIDSDAEGPTSQPNLTVNGTYNGSYDGVVTLTLNAGDSKITASASWSPVKSGAPASFIITNNTITLGDGIILSLVDPTTGADQWKVTLMPALSADTLRIDDKIYTFVRSDTPSPRSNEIIVAANINTTAENIKARIEFDNLSVSPTRSVNVVTLTAKTAGKAGELIPIQASGSWATINPMSGGADPSFTPATNDIPDKARNAVITIDFNEAVDKTQVNSSNIIVEYNNGTTWVAVPGSYLVSNQYRTVDILSKTECLNPLTGSPVINSCGDKIFCWPYNDQTPYEATHYRVRVKAGLLKECNLTGNNCTDPNFNSCVALPPGGTGTGGNACQGTIDDTAVNYPKARTTPATPDGIVDAADNSMNGNSNTYTLSGKIYGRAEGPIEQSDQPAYSLNVEANNTGDDLIWEFYINKNLDLSPPLITEIGPTVGGSGASLTAPVEATFDEVMMSSSLKPGSNYRDGYCYCDATNSACPDGQTCDPDAKKCKSDSGEQEYCFEDKECPNNDAEKKCLNKKYVNLVNPATFQVGWWVAKQNLDTLPPLDSYADQTQALIKHTKFAEVTQYGAEMGSGVKDNYQNCYLPSSGPQVEVCNPNNPTDCCIGGPYCCNGISMNQAAWRTSSCFTGY